MPIEIRELIIRAEVRSEEPREARPRPRTARRLSPPARIDADDLARLLADREER